MSDKILPAPCPFCGAPARTIKATRSAQAEYLCSGMRNCPTTRASSFLLQWNTRPQQEADRATIRAKDALIAELEQAIRFACGASRERASAFIAKAHAKAKEAGQ